MPRAWGRCASPPTTGTCCTAPRMAADAAISVWSRCSGRDHLARTARGRVVGRPTGEDVRQLSPPGHTELLVDATETVVHTADRQVKALADLWAGHAACGEQRDLTLPRRQSRGIGELSQRRRLRPG